MAVISTPASERDGYEVAFKGGVHGRADENFDVNLGLMNTFTQRNGITARTVDATLEAPRGLFQNNVIDDATLADDKVPKAVLDGG